MRRPLLLLVALALAAPAVAWATGGRDKENQAQTADALAIQALSLILQHKPPHDQAVMKLDEALAADVKGAIDLRALRAAHAALHKENFAAARRFLEHAFPGESAHIVGVTYRPAIGTAQAVAGIVGTAVLALAALGLVRRRAADREDALS